MFLGLRSKSREKRMFLSSRYGVLFHTRVLYPFRKKRGKSQHPSWSCHFILAQNNPQQKGRIWVWHISSLFNGEHNTFTGVRECHKNILGEGQYFLLGNTSKTEYLASLSMYFFFCECFFHGLCYCIREFIFFLFSKSIFICLYLLYGSTVCKFSKDVYAVSFNLFLVLLLDKQWSHKSIINNLKKSDSQNFFAKI